MVPLLARDTDTLILGEDVGNPRVPRASDRVQRPRSMNRLDESSRTDCAHGDILSPKVDNRTVPSLAGAVALRT